MKLNATLRRLALLSILVFSVWLFWPAMPEQALTLHKSTVTQAVITPQSSTPMPVEESTSVIIKPEKITSHDSATLVAKAYAAELSFPAYSQPLTNLDVDRLEPNYFNPQTLPVDDVGATVSATLSKYRYTYPEPVFATLSGENIESAILVVVDLTSGKSLLKREFEQGNNHWAAQFDGERDFPWQLQATVKARVNGKDISLALAFKYIDSVATLESFDPAYSQDADMIMKAHLTTQEQGLYRVRANLFDANKQPIAHLVSKQKLNKGSDSIELKAHQSVLQGKQAPFYLSTFSIELMSPAPGTPTKYGDSTIIQYEIKDFAVSSLSDSPYQPTRQEQQRLQLLQNMAQGR